MSETIVVPSSAELLARSNATASFREALTAFEKTGKPNRRIQFSHANPPVKVLRALLALLEQAPGLAVDSVVVEGVSGCSDYRGTITVNDGEKHYEFVWDCAWKAQEMGWKDFLGYPDQARAARLLGFRCMKALRETN